MLVRYVSLSTRKRGKCLFDLIDNLKNDMLLSCTVFKMSSYIECCYFAIYDMKNIFTDFCGFSYIKSKLFLGPVSLYLIVAHI